MGRWAKGRKYHEVRAKVDIIRNLQARFNLELRDARRIFDYIVLQVAVGTANNGRFVVRKFGIFEIKHRAARIARNLQTNEQIALPETDAIVFKPARRLYARLRLKGASARTSRQSDCGNPAKDLMR